MKTKGIEEGENGVTADVIRKNLENGDEQNEIGERQTTKERKWTGTRCETRSETNSQKHDGGNHQGRPRQVQCNGSRTALTSTTFPLHFFEALLWLLYFAWFKDVVRALI